MLTFANKTILCSLGSIFILLATAVFQRSVANQDDQQDPVSKRSYPGLLATFTVDGKSYLRIEPDILYSGSVDDENVWKADPRLPTGPFRVRWTAQLNIVEAGTYQFHFYGQGRFQVWLDGSEILSADSKQSAWHASQTLELPYGAVELEAEYESTGDSSVGLYWSSNHFQLEPIEANNFTRPSDVAAKADHAMGRALSRALRCQACHEFARQEPHLAAPSLTHLVGNLKPAWLIDQLTDREDAEMESQSGTRRMPYYGLSEVDARAITAALLAASEPSEPPQNWGDSLTQLQLHRKSKDPPVRTTPDLAQGQQSFVSQGCIACHQVGELGVLSDSSPKASDLFAGGDLSQLTNKRPAAALARWLTDPQSINVDHRMPVFELTLHQKLDLHAWLQQSNHDIANSEHDLPSQPPDNPTDQQKMLATGRQLIEKHQCGACHRLPQSLLSAPVKTRVNQQSDWTKGCLSSQHSKEKTVGKPAFKLTAFELESLSGYLHTTDAHSGVEHPEQVLAEHNCLSCHRRGTAAGIFKHFVDLAENFPELSTRLAAMTPPALAGVGDKLHRSALTKALGPEPERLRDWLDIRMPKFRLSQQQIDLLSDHFISHDRIPENTTWKPAVSPEAGQDQAYWLAAGRLVTPDGFSCQSCHQIADHKPSGIALNAHGTDLTVLGRRIREPWFYRWVRNPSRIVPRMEMPAIQTPVHGVLGDSLDVQLQALWLTLNRPDFRPPKPNPVRVIRNYNDGSDQYAHVLTDVIEIPAVVIRPLVVGLPNRHNLMIDLANGGMHRWWLGDLARQHTRGKSWYWEPGAESLVKVEGGIESWKMIDNSGAVWLPTAPTGKQFAMELDQMQHVDRGSRWRARLHFSNPDGTRRQSLQLEQQLTSVDDLHCNLQTTVQGLTAGQRLRIESAGSLKIAENNGNSTTIVAAFESGHRLEYLSAAQLDCVVANSIDLRPQAGQASLQWQSQFRSAIAPDRFTRLKIEKQPRAAKELDCVPGFRATELPVPISEMPISFAWDNKGNGFIGSLKGRVLQLLDTDQDGWEDDYQLISDEIPTPYGLYAGQEGIDVLAKFGLLRLTPSNYGGPLRDWQVVADGWGYTQDYHDWAVGLERDPAGNYFITLPCQQDDRSPAAAHLRGHALKLVRQTSLQDERLYTVESLAAGLRFPMGLAMNSSGDLFSSDNQGNYTPFNELNHLRSGKRYGFINKLENKNGFAPPFESPAINIPHPWMRSVNGICFMESPQTANQPNLFGPFEGHLLGCEMNGRCLVRMSLQMVDGHYQGGVYPFSLPITSSRESFEGPIACKLAPSGDIYIGNLRDSGWGGGNNTGSIVRLRPDGKWPVGIAEVRAISGGLEVLFTQPVDGDLASRPQSYSVRSYIRTPTPAYGGDDQEVRSESVQSVEVDDSGQRVVLKLNKLRQGAVYELNVAAIGLNSAALFPSQAHYTMRAIPK